VIIETAEAITQMGSSLSYPLYYEQAPQGTEGDYAVFFIVGGGQEEYMGGRDNNIKDLDIQVNIFSNSDDSGYRIMTMKQQYSDLFDWTTSLPVENYHVLKVQPVSFFQVPIQDLYRQFTINHEIQLEKF
jgi:hypothetical protein